MSKKLKTILFWSIVFPLLTTALRLIIDFLLGREIAWISYTGVYLGATVVGLAIAVSQGYVTRSTKN
ncbi:hypothetical protein VBD025_14445 [Virgibacillus flavescens]|uniref:hypothetical protein n=1 Tax=Virgibacillus flavescens TaxID=1611422 RepID=UPI003D33663A